MPPSSRWYSCAGLLACLVLSASLSSVAYAGTNAWTTGGPYGGSVYVLTVDPTNPQTLYAGLGGVGLFKSTDAGVTWAPTGLKGWISSLVIDPAQPSPL